MAESGATASVGARKPAFRPEVPAVVAWCLYDWANSAFPTVVTTFVFATYFTTSVAETPTIGMSQWGYALGLAALFVAMLSPVMGAIADQGGRRKPWLFACTMVCVVATAALWLIKPFASYLLPALLLVVVASVAFDLAMVFYDALLPRLVPKPLLGRVSGWAWGAGYAGGLACLMIALYGFLEPRTEWQGHDEPAAAVRATNLLVAAWFALFSLPIFVFVRERDAKGVALPAAVRAGLQGLRQTVRGLAKRRQILGFLCAYMLYMNGLTTLFAFGGIYAAGTFGLELADVLRFGIALNVSAGIGAAAFGWIDDAIGPRRTICIALLAILLLGCALAFVSSVWLLWVLGLLLGIFVGPAQAASRSLMARVAPGGMEAQMFGLYALAGRATAFAGPMLVAALTDLFDSQRAGMCGILAFVLAGLLVLFRIPVDRDALEDPRCG